MNGSNLRNLRLRLGFTQKELATEIRVNPNTIARWERDEIPISEKSSSKILSVALSNPSQLNLAQNQIYPIDDLHSSILQRLEGKLNPELFEQCAVDLVGQVRVGVVLVGGVKDGGFDGAVCDENGQEPFPLIVTIAKDSLSNLRKNLISIKKIHSQTSQVFFATSRRITNAMRRKLCEEAQKNGVALTQIFDQFWFASELYKEPNWCQRLLGITGQPRALSRYPISPRRRLNNQIFGREKEIQWLLNRKSDCVVEGVPGSGKTFLLEILAAQGNALFLTEWNWQQIARDLRKFEPEAIIVDDAHIHIDKISKLNQLRHEVQALNVRIIASSWPSGTNEIISQLCLLNEDTLTLKLIDADTMVNIMKSVGLDGPDELLWTIKHQAAGRPGLAVTLADICLKGNDSDFQKVLTGEHLLDQITVRFKNSLGIDDPSTLLAPFALGGNAGILPERVAKYFNYSNLEITKNLSKLGTTGIINEHANGAISVVPESLQSVLVYQSAFIQIPKFQYERLLGQGENYYDSLVVLIDVRAKGAWIPSLEAYLEKANDIRLWNRYVSIGPNQVDYVLRNHPDIILEIAGPALLHQPERSVPLLLDRVNMSAFPVFNFEDEATRKLKEWAVNALPERDKVLQRRRTLIESAIEWYQQNKNIGVAVRAMLIALNPKYEFSSLDPGSGRMLTIRRGVLSNHDLRELTEYWPTILRLLKHNEGWLWTELLEFISEWTESKVIFALSNELTITMREFPKRIVLDLIDIAKNMFFVRRRLLEFAKDLNLKVEADKQVDWELEQLFPELDWNEYQKSDRYLEPVQYWKHKRPEELANLLNRARKEAAREGNRELVVPSRFIEHLARDVTSALDFAKTLVKHELPYDLVQPFAREASNRFESGWDEFAKFCLESSRYLNIGVEIALTQANPRSELLSLAILQASGVEDRVGLICTIKDLPRKSLFELFQADNSSLAISAAIGHWYAVETNELTDYRSAEWRQAILRTACDWEGSVGDQYRLEQILTRDPILAKNWLCTLVSSNEFVSFSTTKLAKTILGRLNVNERYKILNCINTSFRNTRIVEHIVGDELKLYRILLSLKHLAHLQLAPLNDPSEINWPKKALLAIDAKYSNDEIVFAVDRNTSVLSGSRCERLEAIRKRFEILLLNPEVRLRQLGARGVEIYDSEIKRQQEIEHQQSILGI